MGEPSLELLEQNVQHMSEDVRSHEKSIKDHDSRIYQLESNMQITNQAVQHVNEKMTDLTSSIKTLEDKLDKDRTERQASEIQNLKSYKDTVTSNMWKIAGTLIVTIVGGVIVAVLTI